MKENEKNSELLIHRQVKVSLGICCGISPARHGAVDYWRALT
jgi:hypothetical protein